MKLSIILTPLFALASVSLLACSSADPGEPGDAGGSSIELRATSANGPVGPTGLTTQDDGGGSLEIVEARALVRHIELDFADDDWSCADFEGQLEGPVSCEDDEKIVIEGPFDVDLLTGQATPSLAGLTIPVAEYDRADVRIQSDDGPSFEATALVDGEITSVQISLDFTEDARFESDDGVLLDQEAGALLLQLDVDAWFADVPLTQCIEDGEVEVKDDEAVIDEDTSGSGRCSDVENVLKDNIKDSGDLLPG